MTKTQSAASLVAALVALASLAACHGNATSSAPRYTISGTVSGLASGAGVVLLDNGDDALPVYANGGFRFEVPLPLDGSYAVTILEQPPHARCTVTHGGGAGLTADVTNVAVACSADTFTIGGTLSGLAADSGTVTLVDNAADPLTLTADGAFTFATPVAYDGAYTVTVAAQPTGAVCTVTHGSGAGVTADVANIGVTCATDSYSIGGVVSGLASGAQVTLDDNGADPLTLTADGAFTFATPVAYDGAYTVTVAAQPTGAVCTVTHGSGAGVTADVANIGVTCATDSYSIGGVVSGLASGAQVTLDDNGADPLTLTADGAFTFATPVAYDGSYAVTVGTQPTGATCTVANGSGTGVMNEVTGISVTCSADSYTISGSLAGLAAGTQLTLEDNGADSLTLTANGAFTFATPIVYGGAYAVTVATPASAQYCTVSDGAGSDVTANVSGVSASCTANPLTFATAGSYQWTVPTGVTQIQVVATGAGGGGGGLSGTIPGASGGAGAAVTSTLSVTPGQVFALVVGGGGAAGTNGPGNSNGYTCGAGGGGGGSSNFAVGQAEQIIAGGGGGGSACNGTSGGSGDAGNDGAGGNGGSHGGHFVGGYGGAGGVGGQSGAGTHGQAIANGGNGAGGAGGGGGSNGGGSIPGGAGGSGSGAGSGGDDTQNDIAGGGGGGYGGGGAGFESTGGGAGGSTGPNGSTYATASNGGASASNGGDGSITITIL